MTPTVEKILAEVKALSQSEKMELKKALTEAPLQPKNIALIRELRGKYKGMTSTEELMACKQHEIDLEERLYRPT